MDEDQCLLYDACKNIGIENILTIKEFLIEMVNTNETLNNMIRNEHHDIIWSFAIIDQITIL